MDWPAWPEYGIVALDLESNDPKLKKDGPGWRTGAYICGVAVAFGGAGAYLAVQHEGGGNVENPDRVWEYLRDQAKRFKGKLVGANILYDLDGLRALHGIDFRQAQICDVQVLAKLVDTKYFEAGAWGAPGYSLDQLLRRAGLPTKAEDGIMQAWAGHPAAQRKDGTPRVGFEKMLKGNLWRLHANQVEEYAVWDAAATLELLARYEPLVPTAVWELEQDVSKMLLDIRSRGMVVDESRLEDVTADLQAAASDVGEKLNRLCGRPVSAMSAADLAPHLVAAGYELGKTKTGKPAIQADWLKNNPGPLSDAIRECRDTGKLLSMAKSLPRFLVSGRIHPILNQFGAATGRMSCSNPNAQQQPARKDVAKLWRRLFVAPAGSHFFCCDFSAQEPRWIAHWGEAAGNPQYAQAFRDDPGLDVHTWVAELCGIPRDKAKTIGLGKSYGMGGGKLCRSLGLPTAGWKAYGTDDIFPTRGEALAAYRAARMAGRPGWDGPATWEAPGPEGKRLIDAYDNRFPVVKMTSRAVADSAAEQGAVWTWTGRRISVRHGHKALNYISQGSASDHTKKAAVDVWRECPEAAICMLVHDEIVGYVADPSVAARVAEIMERPHSEYVPHVVKPATGASWAECK